MKSHIILITIVLCAASAILASPQQRNRQTDQKPRAARSVHLAYTAPETTAFYTEMIVDESQTGSYFMACGFRHGYFGIQELWNGNKIAIFSVWDPGNQNDPNALAQEQRVKILFEGEGVDVSRFGGEGTGGKSMFPFDWKTGETYRFLVTSKVEGDKSTYTGYIYLNDKKEWKKLASFQTITGGDNLEGLYSFVEDFRRDGKTPDLTRKARYGNGWVRSTTGDWVSLTRARFTADSTPLLNIDAGLEGDWFFLATGGKVENKTKLYSTITRQPTGLSLPDEVVNPKKSDIPQK